MALDPATPRTRRTVLTAAAAAAAAAVAQAVARPLPMAASGGDNGKTVTVGGQYFDVSVTTFLYNTTGTANILDLQSTDGAPIVSKTTSGMGVIGASFGSGTGVQGISATGIGVHGVSTSGYAVRGNGATGAGVYGNATSGTGVLGDATTGTGGFFQSASGRALDVSGKAHFSRSGRATITAGHRSVDVTVPGGLSGTSMAFANLRIYRSGTAVAAVRANYPSAGKIRIYLTRTMTSSTTVNWLVID
jgi:hypothetical protein